MSGAKRTFRTRAGGISLRGGIGISGLVGLPLVYVAPVVAAVVAVLGPPALLWLSHHQRLVVHDSGHLTVVRAWRAVQIPAGSVASAHWYEGKSEATLVLKRRDGTLIRCPGVSVRPKHRPGRALDISDPVIHELKEALAEAKIDSTAL